MRALAVLAVLAVVLAGCANQLRGMRAVPEGQAPVGAPPDKAVVVFLRPGAPGWTTSLFHLKQPQDTFVGLLVVGTKLRYVTDPGPARFMVLGQGTADFIDAELAAGKTYYLLVTPGTGPAMFSLAPAGDAPQLGGWLRDCQWVENTPRTETWAQQHWTSIQTRKREYLPRWEARRDRPVLRAADGR